MRKSTKDFERKSKSRLDMIAEAASSNEKKTGVASIAGNKVTQTEAQRGKQASATTSTTVRIPKDLKDKCMALASLKQITFTDLVIHALKRQIKRNSVMLNQFTNYKIDPNTIDDDM